MQYRPQEAAHRLGIAASTLRLWSAHFADQLSHVARKVDPTGAGPTAQRRYIDEDLRVLSQVKQMLGQGLTYEDVKRRLRPPAPERPPASRGRRLPPPPRQRLPEPDLDEELPAPAAATTRIPEELHLSIAGLKEALDAKDKTIAALKESLGFLDVYLHALKEERDDARRRVRDLEQELDEQREMVRELERQLLKPWWKRMAGVT